MTSSVTSTSLLSPTAFNADISESEVAQAIKNIRLLKAPGPDGFSGLYYCSVLFPLAPPLDGLLQQYEAGCPAFS